MDTPFNITITSYKTQALTSANVHKTIMVILALLLLSAV